MQLVKISLNVDREPMFFIGDKIHLTYENPGPVEVDPTTLTEEQKSWIDQAYRRGILFVDNPNKKVDKVAVEEKEKIARTPIPAPEFMSKKKEESFEQIKALLSGKVSAIKNTINGSSDILFIRLMKEAETDGKNRKSVLSTLNDRIGVIQSELVDAIGGDQGELGTHVTSDDLRNLPQVEEVMEKTIQIKPLSETDK